MHHGPLDFACLQRMWCGISSPPPQRSLHWQNLCSLLLSVMEKAGFKTNSWHVPLFAAMYRHAASCAISNGDENAMALARPRMLRLGFLLLPVKQPRCLRNAEVHSVIASC